MCQVTHLPKSLLEDLWRCQEGKQELEGEKERVLGRVLKVEDSKGPAEP